tara:strand:- start:102 stop:305 length:204 start_codon:yes stop_codon:yes gene_type:complete
MNESQEDRENLTYENETQRESYVSIPLKEYDKLKEEQSFIKDKSLIAIIDKVEELIRALRKRIIRDK